MLNLLLSGCNGKMGQVVSTQVSEVADMQIVAGLDRVMGKNQHTYPVFQNPCEFVGYVDVVIDFSHPSFLETLLAFCLERKVPLVCATTGLSMEQMTILQKTSKEIPILYSANMSLGVNLLVHLVEKAALVLHESFDIEILEKHHNKKRDAPSGTAYILADAINESLGQTKNYIFGRAGSDLQRPDAEIGIHAIRGGTIAGEHSVIFAGDDEVIELKHTALSKRIFAVGALRAAQWIVKQKCGFYKINDLFQLESLNQLVANTLTT